jgi:hypothetical protein
MDSNLKWSHLLHRNCLFPCVCVYYGYVHVKRRVPSPSQPTVSSLGRADSRKRRAKVVHRSRRPPLGVVHVHIPAC